MTKKDIFEKLFMTMGIVMGVVLLLIIPLTEVQGQIVNVLLSTPNVTKKR